MSTLSLEDIKVFDPDTYAHGDPTTFLVTCSDGTVSRYRSDGSDLSDADTVSDGSQSSSLFGPSLTAQPMTTLGTKRLPNGSGDSASIAFDGTFLYYATHAQPEGQRD